MQWRARVPPLGACSGVRAVYPYARTVCMQGMFYVVYPHNGTTVCVPVNRTSALPSIPSGAAFASWPLVGGAYMAGELLSHRRMSVAGTSTKIGVCVSEGGGGAAACHGSRAHRYIRVDDSLAAVMNAGGMAETQRCVAVD